MVFKLMEYWQKLQEFLDVRGDVILLGFTGAIVFKILHGGLTVADATAYSSCIVAFAYSNVGKPK